MQFYWEVNTNKFILAFEIQVKYSLDVSGPETVVLCAHFGLK